MTKNLNRRSFLGILGGLLAGVATGFKINASPIIVDSLEESPILDYETFQVKKYGVTCYVSDELLADSKIDLGKYIRQEFSQQMALEMNKWEQEIEAKFLYGTGVGEPVGIINVSETREELNDGRSRTV